MRYASMMLNSALVINYSLQLNRTTNQLASRLSRIVWKARNGILQEMPRMKCTSPDFPLARIHSRMIHMDDAILPGQLTEVDSA